MAAEIAERARARLLAAAAPGEGQVGVVEEALVEPAAEAHRRADVAAVDQLLGQHRRRGLDVVEGDHGLDAGLARGGRHLLGFGQRDRQRLLAVDVLAGGDGGERHLLVHGVRRGDVDDVDGGVVHQRAPVAGALLEAEARGGVGGERVVGVGQHVEVRPGGQVAVEHAGAAEGVGMGLAHEARADEADVEGSAVMRGLRGFRRHGEGGKDVGVGAGDGRAGRGDRRVLLGLDHQPAPIARGAHEAGDGGEVDGAVAGDGEHAAADARR